MIINSKERQKKLAKIFKKYEELKCLSYSPFSYQLEAHEATEELVFVQLPNRVGKSFCAVREGIFWFRGIHPYKKLTKTNNLTIWIVSETMSMANEAIFEKKIKQMIPAKEYTLIKEMSMLVGIEHKITKNRIYFKAMAKGSSRVQSSTVDLVIIDEMPPDFSTFTELLQRVRGAHGISGKGGQVYMTFTPLKLVKKIKDFITNPDSEVKVIRATAYDCPMYTKEEVDKAKKIYPEREFRVRYLGEWASYEGALVPSFDESCIVDDFHIPDKWRKILCIDPASSGFVGLSIMAESDRYNEEGKKIWYVVKEAQIDNIEPNKLVDFAEEFASDYTISNRFSDQHESWFIKTANSKGILYLGVKKLKNEEMVVELDNSFAEGTLFVFKSCEELQNQLFSYVNKESSQKFDPVKGDYHILDAIKYGNRMKGSLGKIKDTPIKLSPLWESIERQFFKPKSKKIFSESI